MWQQLKDQCGSACVGPGRLVAIGIVLVTSAAIAWAAVERPLRVLRQLSLAQNRLAPAHAMPPTHRMRLKIGVIAGSGWRAEDVLDSARIAAGILGQCAIRTESIELDEIDAPPRYRSLFTPVSRELAARLAFPKPALFFVADTLQQPAFDAEAIGRGNSRTRPEMADTVWIAFGARELPVVIAHELAHVLADSGEHSTAARNLMRDETAPGATLLTTAQCEAIVARGTANGLLQPLRP